jgi:DNA repair photolyase
VKTLFRDWLERHYPLKAKHVMSRVHELRGGRDNDPNFGSRMRGQGTFAELLAKRFEIAKRRIGYDMRSRMLRNASLGYHAVSRARARRAADVFVLRQQQKLYAKTQSSRSLTCELLADASSCVSGVGGCALLAMPEPLSVSGSTYNYLL